MEWRIQGRSTAFRSHISALETTETSGACGTALVSQTGRRARLYFGLSTGLSFNIGCQKPSWCSRRLIGTRWAYSPAKARICAKILSGVAPAGSTWNRSRFSIGNADGISRSSRAGQQNQSLPCP